MESSKSVASWRVGSGGYVRVYLDSGTRVGVSNAFIYSGERGRTRALPASPQPSPREQSVVYNGS